MGDRASGNACSRVSGESVGAGSLAAWRHSCCCIAIARHRGASLTADARAMAARLVAAGLHSTELDAKSRLFARALAALGSDASDATAWWVPGRIEFLGKHTDYAGGRSLLCAAERGFAVVSVPRSS